MSPSAPMPATGLRGLSAAEAAERLPSGGPHALPAAPGRSAWRIVVDVVREPMLALLLGGGIVYALLGSLAEAAVLVCFAGFSIIVSVVQQSRTEHVLQSLRDLAAPRALVVRDGTPTRVA